MLLKTYHQAGIDPSTISYIETHGTGTELGDPIEVEGLKNAFSTLLKDQSFEKPFCGLGSVKTNIGHLEPASGVAGIAKVLLAMKHDTLPGNLHFHELNPYIKLENTPFYIVEKTQPWRKQTNDDEIPRRAGVSSFGFGGTCAHVLLEEVVSSKQSSKQIKPAYLFTLSTKHVSSLKNKIRSLAQWLKENLSVTDIEALSYTMNVGKAHFDNKCAIVASSLDELLKTLELLIQDITPENCFFSSEQKNKAITGSATTESTGNKIISVSNVTLSATEYRSQLFSVANNYVQNMTIDWEFLHQNETKTRIAGLPPYPFIKKRYWFDAETKADNKPSPIAITETVNLEEFSCRYLKLIFAEKLGVSFDQIDIDTTYEVYGVDSLIGLEITNRLETDFGTLPKTLLYERNHIRDLTQYLLKKYNDKLMALAKDSISVFNSDRNDRGDHSIANRLEIENATKVLPKLSANNLKDDSSRQDDIAIIGLNGIFPMASDMNEFWHNLEIGRDCISEVPNDRWNYKDYPVQVGGEEKYFKYGGFINDVDKFDPLFFGISPRDANLMDPQERLFMQTTWATLEDAGYTREKLKTIANNQVGVFAGVTYNFYPLFIAEEWAKNNRIPLDIQLFSIANRISYFMNFSGPSYVVDTACSSSLAAIHLACESLKNGECVMAIAGGVNLTLHPSKYHFLGSYSFMSDQGRCASFAEGGSGYVPSEGVGAVLLKPLSLAIRDKDRIYGIIKASSMNHGGKTSGYTVPNPNAQSEVIKSALRKAQIDARSISYIEAHGTGTALGDPIEVRGLQEAFEEFTQDKQFCAIGSVKSNIGHLESAAGVSQLAKVLLQMQHQKLVPSIHAEHLNPFIDFSETPFYVQRELQDWQPAVNVRRAGVSSFGAGGANVHLIVEEYTKSKSPLKKIDVPFIFVLSALNQERLKDYLEKIKQFLTEQIKNKNPEQIGNWLYNVCYTLQSGRESMNARLGIIANDVEELLTKLNQDNLIDSSKMAASKGTPGSSQTTASIEILIQQRNYSAVLDNWLTGMKISWDSLYRENMPELISLPTYPFAQRRCWIAQSNRDTTVKANQDIDKSSSPDVIIPSASSTAPDNDQSQAVNDAIKKHWLILSDKELGFFLKDKLRDDVCLYCFRSDAYKQLDDHTFYLNPDKFDDYYKLFLQIYEDNHAKLEGVIYLWTSETGESDENQLSKLSFLFKAMIQHKWHNQLKIMIVTRAHHTLSQGEPVRLIENSLSSYLGTLEIETSAFKIQLVDLDEQKQLRMEAQQIIEELQNDTVTNTQIVFRNNKRFSLDDSRVQKTEPPAKKSALDSEFVLDLVVNKLSKLLELDVTEIDVEVPFQNYGMDSIIGINFVAEINEHFSEAISPMDLYRYPSAHLLAGYIVDSKNETEVVNTVASENKTEVESEDKFISDTSHLSVDELNKLLEEELKNLGL